MSYKLKVSFPDSVSAEKQSEFGQTVESKMTGRPAGMISHDVVEENGRQVVYDEWESQQAFEQFKKTYLESTSQELGLPMPHIEEL